MDDSSAPVDPASFVYPADNRTSRPSDHAHPHNLDPDSPVTQHFLRYVRIPELREPVLCGFAKLMEKNGIATGLLKWDHALSPCVWEMLSPLYDHMAASMVPIALRLLEADPSRLYDIAEKTFLTPNWTNRFQGLDNLYGLYNKLNDLVLEKEQKPVLKVLGRLFGYFLSCLWDPEEPVRTKAMTYVCSMNSSKIKIGLETWGVFFNLGDRQEKIAVCKQMLQANAIFPKWTVLDWEVALDQLERRNSGSEEGSTDQCDLNCYLVNLLMQMIASGVDTNLLHLRRLKHLIGIYAGFSDCTFDRITSETVPIVKFGRLVFDPSDHSQRAALSTLVRGLRDILDKAFEEPSQSRHDSPEKEIHRVGNEFVDMALMLFSSDLDLTKIGDLMLKEWLELVQIVIYKYNVDEISGKLVSVVKEITNVLDSNISEENKQRSISICLSLLRRSTVITASVLSRQILSMGKLLVRLKDNRNAVAACKARQFLKLAFKNYATNGLFVLLFKNPSKTDICNDRLGVNHEDAEIDIFFILKEVLFDDYRTAKGRKYQGDDEEDNESVLLREEPIKDVLGRLLLFKELKRRSFSTVLLNLSLYIENVFPGYYEPELLHDFGMFIPKLLRHTADWKRSEWDINPVMAIAASIMRVHPTECHALLAPVKSLVKHAILRCSVTLASVVLVLNACNTVASFAERETAGLAERFVLDELRLTLRGKTKMSRCTFLALVQLVCWERRRDLPTDFPCLTAEDLEKVDAEIRSLPVLAVVEFFGENTPSFLEDCVAYLEGFRWNQPEDFEIGIWITQLVISLSSSVPSPFSTLLSSQKMTDVSRTLKLLNWITLGLLRSPIPKLFSGSLDFEAAMSQLMIHALEYHQHNPHPHHAPENSQQTDSGPPVSGPVLLSFLLIKMRTALGTLILCGNRGAPPCSEEKTWISVWPYFRRRLVMPPSSMNARDVNDFVGFWEQFLHLVLFLHGCSAEISLSYKDEWYSVMENVSQKFNVPSLVAKIRKVQSTLDAPQPSRVHWDVRNVVMGLTGEWEAALRLMSLQGRKA